MSVYNSEVSCGSLYCYQGLTEPDGWIFCDGIKRENINNVFKNILELGIGELENDYYIPPNYDNFIFCKLDELKEKIYRSLLEKRHLISKHCHSYIDNGKVQNVYFNNYTKRTYENNSYNKINDKNQLFDDSFLKEQIMSNLEKNVVSATTRWIIKL
jgi:hypothetical protein